VDGQFREAYGEAPGRFTLRQHVRRHTWFSPLADWLLNFWMGQDIDTPITVWQEMFLPAEVGNRIADFWYTDDSGASRKLVTDREIVYRAQGRPPVLDAPRRQWPAELAVGLAAAVLLALVLFLQEKRPLPGQIILGVGHSLLGLFFGIAGLLLFFMALFTNHDYTFHNSNLLFANPLLLAAIPLGIRYAKSNNEQERIIPEFLLKVLWLLVLLGLFLSMLIKLFPGFYQQNLVDQMLFLPIALILCLEPWGIRRILERIFWRWFN
jgi:protein-S-isoprenylcysteine O-methyltransferase Ste14